ncbi:MAG: imidazoleglycerol-phosphate dehydratase HisB [Thermosulfidibacteraceae bacterium]
MRAAKISRVTKETDVEISLVLDGSGKFLGTTGIGFMDHMMELLAKHSQFDIDVRAKGDTQVDYHHLIEDLGIVFGIAFKEALGDKRGIRRYGHSIIPMDEALVFTAIDISGRSGYYMKSSIDTLKMAVSGIPFADLEEFFKAFTRSADVTLHIRILEGVNVHHIVEAMFKSFAVSLLEATGIVREDIPSSKGVI